MKFGSAIRTARSRAGLSQRELARRAGVDGSLISRLEVDARVPSIALLERLADVLGVPAALLLLRASEQEDLAGVLPADAAALADRLESLLGEVAQVRRTPGD
jgi:transcriptional regulator with XRE-family HTH domain